MKNMKLNRLVNICLNLMDIASEDKDDFEKRLGLGYLAFCSIIMSGVKELVEMKYQLAACELNYKFEKKENEELRDLLKKAFGDSDIDTLNKDTLDDIIEYARLKMEE